MLNSPQFRPFHLRQLEVTPRVNLVRPCSCPWKPHNGSAVFCLFLSSFPRDHVQAQAIEWRWAASICMRVMQFGSVGKHACETSQIVKKLIPVSNGDEPKATSLSTPSERNIMGMHSFLLRHQPRLMATYQWRHSEYGHEEVHPSGQGIIPGHNSTC